jgi:hypothetical protein
MEISKLFTVDRCDKGAEMEVIDPATREGTGAFIRLAGVDSAAFRRANDTAEEKMFKKGARKITPDERRRIQVEIIAACTLAWRGLEQDGKEWPCTFDNAVTLYEASPAVREQVDLFIANRVNFLRD